MRKISWIFPNSLHWINEKRIQVKIGYGTELRKGPKGEDYNEVIDYSSSMRADYGKKHTHTHTKV